MARKEKTWVTKIWKEQLAALEDGITEEELLLPSIPYVSPYLSFNKLGRLKYYHSGDADRL